VIELIALVALGLGVGCYGTIIGAGGGFILVPVLLIFYPDEDPDTLTAISLFVVFVNAVSGSIAYWRQRRIDYLTGLFFAACSLPGVVAGAVLVNFVPGRLFTAAFGLMLLLLAVVSWQSRSPAVREPLRGAGVLRREVTDTEGRRYVYAYRTGQAAALSLGIGFISSLFGIGGGVIQVPTMIIMLHIPAMFATATSLFTLSFMSGGATFIHLVSGTLSGDPLARAAALAVGAVPGAQIGAVFAQRIKPRYVLILLAVSISVLGVRLLVKAIFDL
jgi:uncharacterized protein